MEAPFSLWACGPTLRLEGGMWSVNGEMSWELRELVFHSLK